MTSTRFLCLLAVGLTSCASTLYSPPIRSTHYGPPARVPPRRLDVSGAATFPWTGTGGPRLAYAFNDWLQIEGGGEFAAQAEWMLGYGGLRFTPLNWTRNTLRIAVDLEVGLGLGVGGVLYCGPDCDVSVCDRFPPYCGRDRTRSPFERLTGGGYLGAGFGVHRSFFSTFIRARVQISRSVNIPTTLWGSTLLGIAFDVREWFDIYVAGGVAGYYNEYDMLLGPLGEVGMGVSFPLRRRERSD